MRGQAGTTLSYSEKAQLNSLLHFDDNIDTSIICPGDIWVINKQTNFFNLFSSNSEAAHQVALFKSEIHDGTNSQVICMEISPACDFSNNKKPFKTLALGVLVPKADVSNSLEGKLKKSDSLLLIPIVFSGEPSLLIISKKYVMAATTSKIENLQKKYSGGETVIQKVIRMRETLLLSWIQSIASHNSRIGTVSFH